MELGSVTLKRIGFFCFPIKHSTHTGADPGIILSVLVAQLVGRLGGDGFWKRDYGWGVRVRRPFGALSRSLFFARSLAGALSLSLTLSLSLSLSRARALSLPVSFSLALVCALVCVCLIAEP